MQITNLNNKIETDGNYSYYSYHSYTNLQKQNSSLKEPRSSNPLSSIIFSYTGNRSRYTGNQIRIESGEIKIKKKEKKKGRRILVARIDRLANSSREREDFVRRLARAALCSLCVRSSTNVTKLELKNSPPPSCNGLRCVEGANRGRALDLSSVIRRRACSMDKRCIPLSSTRGERERGARSPSLCFSCVAGRRRELDDGLFEDSVR